jgi:hypothetical protein
MVPCASTMKAVLNQLTAYLISTTGALLNNRFVPTKELTESEAEALVIVIAYHLILNSPMPNLPCLPLITYLFTGVIPGEPEWTRNGIRFSDGMAMCARLPKLCSRVINELLPVKVIKNILGFENFCECGRATSSPRSPCDDSMDDYPSSCAWGRQVIHRRHYPKHESDDTSKCCTPVWGFAKLQWNIC